MSHYLEVGYAGHVLGAYEQHIPHLPQTAVDIKMRIGSFFTRPPPPHDGPPTKDGCGGGASASKAPSYTPLPNTETVTVTASSGSLSHTTTFTLTVND